MSEVAPLVKTIRVRADQRRAFEVFTSKVGRWWDAACSVNPSKAAREDVVLEPRVGGRWYERGADGSECTWATVLAWEPPHRLLVEWYAGADWATEVEVRFTAIAPRVTEVRLEHRLQREGAEAELWRGNYGGGWTHMLERYEREAAEIVVHGVPGSPYCRAVLIALEEKPLPYRLAPMAPGAAKTEPHLSPHPFGRVPAIEHGDFTLYETQAILRYLDRLHPAPALSPLGLRELASMDRLLNVCDWYLMQGVNNVIGFHRIVAPRLLGLAPDEAAIAAAMPRAHLVMGVLADALGGQPFLTGDGVTLADILIGAHLDFLSATPEWAALTADRPAMVAWLDRLRARPSFAATATDRLITLARAA